MILRILFTASLGLALAAAASGQERGEYSVSIGPLRAGVLVYEGSQNGGAYTMRGAVRPSALIGAIFDGRIDSVAEGSVIANSYRPRIAKEVTRGDGSSVERTFRYASGVPSVTRMPAKDLPAHAVPASAQGGTVDLSTAAFAILRDRQAALACDLDIAIFDGTRRHRIRLNEAAPDGEGLICTGRYSRIAGFDAEDMAERRHWPLRMEYVGLPDGRFRVNRLTFPTSFGTARITRR